MAAGACTSAPAHQATSERSASPAVPNPAALIRHLATGSESAGPYRDPSRSEWLEAHEAAKALVADPQDRSTHEPMFARLGYQAIAGVDPATGRRYLLYLADSSTDRSWGAVLADLSAPLDTLIEVPHVGFDVNTDLLGIEMFRAHPGSVLLVAGAHRLAAGGSADVAHNDRSVFHAMATSVAKSGLPEVQLHGFADANLPDSDVAVSSGQAAVGPLAKRIASRIEADGFRVCLAWQGRCGRLEGTTNVQGQAAQANSTVFVHIESSWSIRGDKAARTRLVRSIIAAIAEG